jgi:exosortase/archaeosortase family protein
MGLLIAFIATGVVNFIRLTLLIMIGRHSLPAFHLWHTLIWQSSFVLLIAGFYFGWTQWINKKG